jgi:signal transduction histidine kinase
MGYTQMLAKTMPKTPISDQHIETIIRAAGRLNGMITDILNTTKMERGSMTLAPERLESAALAARMRDAHAPDAERRKVSLTAASGDGAEFFGDKALLERVLSNLLGNALKFTPSGGSVTLSCGRRNGDVLFTVSDTGPGVPEDKREIIFEKYAQMEEHSSMGFGLGLAMCKLAIELHKGRIWVEPADGGGSRFIFTLPARGEAA